MQSKRLTQSKLLGHVFRRCSFSLRLFHRCIRMQGQESTSSSKIKLPPMLRTGKKKRIHWPGLRRQGDVSLHKLHIQACTCTVWEDACVWMLGDSCWVNRRVISIHFLVSFGRKRFDRPNYPNNSPFMRPPVDDFSRDRSWQRRRRLESGGRGSHCLTQKIRKDQKRSAKIRKDQQRSAKTRKDQHNMSLCRFDLARSRLLGFL